MGKSRGDETTATLKKAWSRRVIACMDKCELKGTAVADAVGVSPQVVTDWRKGRSLPSVENLLAFAWLVNEPISYLAGDRLHGKRTIDTMSRDLGTRLGFARLEALQSVTDGDLRDAIDLLIGRTIAKGRRSK